MSDDIFARKSGDDFDAETDQRVHLVAKGITCATESRAKKRSRFDIVLDATDGFIPLWARNVVIRWRFNEQSLAAFQKPDAVRSITKELLGKAITAWGGATPIRFTENSDNYDFQIVLEGSDSCSPRGCTLAQAFFPDAGRHKLHIFPKMFKQSDKEQVDTLTHEIGHVFGLRHFFAPEQETRWPSRVFGEHKPFSIMNYGKNSELTDADRNDLHTLYEGAWSEKLKEVNGTPIKLVQPFHTLHA